MELKRKYWPATLGSVFSFSFKLAILLVLPFLLMNLRHPTDVLFNTILWSFSVLLILWIFNGFYFFQRIYLNNKNEFVVETLHVFRAIIPKNKIKSIKVYQTFFDKFFDTFSIKISFLDEEDEEDEFSISGLYLSNIKLLEKYFKGQVDNSSLRNLKIMGESKIEREKQNHDIKRLYKQVTLLWIFNVIILVLVISLFFISFQGSLALKPNQLQGSELNQGSASVLDNKIVFSFINESPISSISLSQQGTDEYVISFSPIKQEDIKTLGLSLYFNDEKLFDYTLDFESNTPTLSGDCVKPGIVNTDSFVDNSFKVHFGYNSSRALCKNIDKAVLMVNDGKSVKTYISTLS
ncbi:MAG: hypothetical protein PWR32_55 [Candidatus Woesearchaeota archaeon]|nr:hypothetical protein [Candidatus Woesearchaeota archaeon]